MTDQEKIEHLETSLHGYRGEMSFSDRYRPLIGISGNFRDGDCTLAEAYWSSVAAAGGIPVIIPPYDDAQAISRLLDELDGLVLSGGADIDPVYLHEEAVDGISVNPKRDVPEILLTKMAADRHLPMLGICRGIQMLAAALGGRLYQDIFLQHGADSLQHSQEQPRHCTSHSVRIAEGSLLESLLGAGSIDVNSFHHQAVREAPQGFRVSATAPDGIIEAIESVCHRSILGVQWHPECMHPAGDERMMPIFEWLTAQSRLYREAKEIHRRSIVVDSHCDTPMFFDKGAHFHIRDEKVTVEYEYVGETSPDGSATFQYTPLVCQQKMRDGGLDASFMVAYLRQGARDDKSLLDATAKADRLLSLIEERIGLCGGEVVLAHSPQEVLANKLEGRRSVVPGIENGYALGKDIRNVAHFAQRGVAYITLCHNGDNDICDSAKGSSEHNGLSEFGKDVVREMNRCGIMTDLSHASEKSFYDALQVSSMSIICSHSSARAICDHPRNLTDDQLRELAKAGGVAQVCLYGGFLRKGGQADIHDAVRHILHMIDIAGIEHVGIGSDFDGGGGICGLEDVSALTELTRLLLNEGLGYEDLRKMWGMNFLKVWQRVRDGRSFFPF